MKTYETTLNPKQQEAVLDTFRPFSPMSKHIVLGSLNDIIVHYSRLSFMAYENGQINMGEKGRISEHIALLGKLRDCAETLCAQHGKPKRQASLKDKTERVYVDFEVV